MNPALKFPAYDYDSLKRAKEYYARQKGKNAEMITKAMTEELARRQNATIKVSIAALALTDQLQLN